MQNSKKSFILGRHFHLILLIKSRKRKKKSRKPNDTFINRFLKLIHLIKFIYNQENNIKVYIFFIIKTIQIHGILDVYSIYIVISIIVNERGFLCYELSKNVKSF